MNGCVILSPLAFSPLTFLYSSHCPFILSSACLSQTDGYLMYSVCPLRAARLSHLDPVEALILQKKFMYTVEHVNLWFASIKAYVRPPSLFFTPPCALPTTCMPLPSRLHPTYTLTDFFISGYSCDSPL